MNERYRLDVMHFVCTCPCFIISQFLLCKHLVQLYCPVNPWFFLEVTRNRSVPFWLHPLLKPLPEAEAGPSHLLDQEDNDNDKDDGGDKGDGDDKA